MVKCAGRPFFSRHSRFVNAGVVVTALFGIACGGRGGCNVGTDPACPASTTTTITSHEPNPSVVGQAVPVHYVVTSPNGTPTGNVTTTDGTASCSGTVSAATCTLTPTTAGAKTLTTTYASEGNFTGSSDTKSHQVDKAPTTTTITAHDPDPSLAGQAVTVKFSVAVTLPGSGTPTGEVTVTDGTASCNSTVVAATCTLTLAGAGPKTITATYAGDANFASSADAKSHSVTTNATTTAITSHTPNPSVVGQPVTVVFTVQATSAGSAAPGGTVTVDDGSGDACSAPVGTGPCVLTPTTAGAKTLTATYAGGPDFAGSSDAKSHQVDKAPTTSTIVTANPDPSVVGQPVAIAYTVTAAAPGAGTPSGTVTAQDGSGAMCSASVATGSCALAPTAVGSKTLALSYAGDGNFLGSSSTKAHQVDKAQTSTAITAHTPDPSVVGGRVTVDFAVTVVSPGSGMPAGSVTVSDGSTSCTLTVPMGSCALEPSTVGSKTLTATYSGDPNFAGSSDTKPHRVIVGFVSLTAGPHDCGIIGTGAAYCWGSNSSGQLGDGSTSSSATPVAVMAAGVSFTAVSTGGLLIGDDHSCAMSGAAVYCWGSNNYGQLGISTTGGGSAVPVLAASEIGFISVSAGDGFHTCGVAVSGAAYCWGGRFFGELGDGSSGFDGTGTPVVVADGHTFSSISAGAFYTCGVTTDHAAYCWGFNQDGQLGDSTTVSRATPTLVTGRHSFATVSAGSGSRTCGLTTSGDAYCWGAGPLGDGRVTGDSAPVLVAGGHQFLSIEVGDYHVCGVATTGSVYCWGGNGDGQLGDGTTIDRLAPVLVSGDLTFTSVRSGLGHACGIAGNGVTYCWGRGNTAPIPLPAQP
jgi:large repetitive protein